MIFHLADVNNSMLFVRKYGSGIISKDTLVMEKSMTNAMRKEKERMGGNPNIRKRWIV